MRAVLPRPAVLCISVASLLAGACTDPQTLMAPVDVQSAVSIMAKPAGPSIASNSGSGVFAIGGTAVSVSLVVDNPSKNGYSNAAAVLTLTQGSATRDLGRYALNCAEAAPGVLPAGTTCSFSVPAAVPAGGGTGSLEAGSAALVATLVQTSGRKDKVLASSSETVTLTQAGGPGGDPSITYFRLHSTSIPLGGAVQYSITIDNPGTATLHPFIVQAVLRQGITEYGAGGTEVPCSGAESGLPPGSCSFSYQTTAPAAASAGVATLEIQIMDEHDILDVRSVPVTLTASGPHIEMIRLA